MISGLHSRLMLLVAVCLTPLALMTVLSGMREREHAIKASEENLHRLTGMAAANVSRSIEGARQILVDLASAPGLMGDAASCTSLLSDALDRNEGFVNLGLIQLNGDVTCSAVPLLHPVNLGDRSHFRRAVRERRFVAGEYVFGRVIKKHTITLTYPVIDRSGKVRAVVAAAMDLASLDSFIQNINLPPGSVMATADAGGLVISHRPDPERYLGKRLGPAILQTIAGAGQRAAVIRGEDGIERLHTFARVGAAGLTDYTLTIGIPTATITSAARHDQLMGLVAGIVLALLAAWLLGEVLIVRRVRQLMDDAGR